MSGPLSCIVAVSRRKRWSIYTRDISKTMQRSSVVSRLSCVAQCKLAWEDNEEEYEDFYEWADEDADSPAGVSTVSLPQCSLAPLEPLSCRPEVDIPPQTLNGRRATICCASRLQKMPCAA